MNSLNNLYSKSGYYEYDRAQAVVFWGKFSIKVVYDVTSTIKQ